jgi:L-asparagine transporter-like permease
VLPWIHNEDRRLKILKPVVPHLLQPMHSSNVATVVVVVVVVAAAAIPPTNIVSSSSELYSLARTLDREFESLSRHGSLCAFILCLGSSLAMG